MMIGTQRKLIGLLCIVVAIGWAGLFVAVLTWNACSENYNGMLCNMAATQFIISHVFVSLLFGVAGIGLIWKGFTEVG